MSLPTSAESTERLDSESPVLGTVEPRHSPFESQLFLFEAVGKLISIEAVPVKQAEYLSVSFRLFVWRSR